MVIASEESFGLGTVILVAVASSNSLSFLPFCPSTKRWCSFGMRTAAWVYNTEKEFPDVNSIQSNRLLHQQTGHVTITAKA